jgi:aerobic-type carbon monoxide dehydrogenase small subunit (CoxS/CutS family)
VDQSFHPMESAHRAPGASGGAGPIAGRRRALDAVLAPSDASEGGTIIPRFRRPAPPVTAPVDSPVPGTRHRIELTVNGTRHLLAVEGDRVVLDVLRNDLALTGTKEGCGIGVCGLCSVLVDGELMSSCLLPAVLADGSSVETVEGLADGDDLSPLQEAFIRHGGFQCGICTPGQLMAATALLRELPEATDAQIRAWMSGNLCRCTGYEGIALAIASVAGGPAPGQDER